MAFSILVCVKAVPDLSGGSPLVITDRWIDEAAVSWRMNAYDAHALEAALAIKDTASGVRVDALSLGPDRVRPTIMRAMAMGADGGIHLAAESSAPLPPETVAEAIARHAGPQKYDLILTGALSEDQMWGITGPLVASALDLPCASAAVALDPNWEEGWLTVHCEMEAGLVEIVRLPFPALVTVQAGRRIPRYPSLSNTLRSRCQAIERVDTWVMKRPEQPVEILEVTFPQRISNCRIIEGTAPQKADALLKLFHDHDWLR